MTRTLTPLLIALLLATAPMAYGAKAKPKPVAAAPVVVQEKACTTSTTHQSPALR